LTNLLALDALMATHSMDGHELHDFILLPHSLYLAVVR
jgi:hypothetical protein